MGEGVSGHITKGIINRKVDLLVNEKNAAGQFHKRGAFLTAIKNAATSADYIGVLQAQAGVTLQEARYLRDTWYEEGPLGFWSWLQPIYPILARGLIRAIEEAGNDLPLETYWSPASDQVEVAIGRSAQQVTRFILTPGTHPASMARTTELDLWLVKRGSAQEQTGRETYDGVVAAVDGNVITWRVRDT